MVIPRCLRAGLLYAEFDWQVVPMNVPTGRGCSCRRGPECGSPGKHPLVKWKEQGGSADPTVIEGWWGRWPWANVAILMGPERSGLFTIDIDPDHGGDASLEALETKHGALPVTLRAVTGSGGRHLLFRHPGTGTKQGAGDLGPGIDTRDHGGLIVAAPSVHRSGRHYRWANWGTAPAELPGWVRELLRPPAPPPRPVRLPARGTTRAGRYGEVALDRSLERVRTATNGNRNWALYCAAAGLGRLAAGGLLDAVSVGYELLEAGLAVGLTRSECEDTIASGLRRGALDPKELAS